MAEGKEQQFGSVFGPFDGPGFSREGVGLKIPPRDPAHADPQWYEMDLDDPIDDPDADLLDPLPTSRHRNVP